MVIPGVVRFVHDLDESDARFNQATCHQALCPVLGRRGILQAVQLFGCGGLLGEIQVLLGSKLHAGGKFVIANSGFEVRGMRVAVGVFLVEPSDQSQVILISPGRQFPGRPQVQYR